MKQTITTIDQMIDIALGTPEQGNINFALLHGLLHIIVDKINIKDDRVLYCGSNIEMVEELLSQLKYTVEVKQLVQDPNDENKLYLLPKQPKEIDIMYVLVTQDDECTNLTKSFLPYEGAQTKSFLPYQGAQTKSFLPYEGAQDVQEDSKNNEPEKAVNDTAFDWSEIIRKLREDLEKLKSYVQCMCQYLAELRENGFDLAFLKQLKEMYNCFQVMKEEFVPGSKKNNDCEKYMKEIERQQKLSQLCSKIDEPESSSGTLSYSSSEILVEFPATSNVPADHRKDLTLSKDLDTRNIYPFRNICDYLINNHDFLESVKEKVLQCESFFFKELQKWQENVDDIGKRVKKLEEEVLALKCDPRLNELIKEVQILKNAFQEFYNVTFIEALKEIQDIFDGKLDKNTIPEFKVFIRQTLEKFQNEINQIKKILFDNCALGALKGDFQPISDLKCISCKTEVCQHSEPKKFNIFKKFKPHKIQIKESAPCNCYKKQRHCGGVHTIVDIAKDKFPSALEKNFKDPCHKQNDFQEMRLIKAADGRTFRGDPNPCAKHHCNYMTSEKQDKLCHKKVEQKQPLYVNPCSTFKCKQKQVENQPIQSDKPNATYKNPDQWTQKSFSLYSH